MKKTLFTVGFSFMMIGLVFSAFAILGIGFGPSGQYTGDADDDVAKRNVYCKTMMEGEWNFGSNIKLSRLECQIDEPFYIADNLAIINAAKDVNCRGYLLKNGQTVTTSNKQTFGDLGLTDEVWYKFGISKVPVGSYKVRVVCESATDPVDSTTIEDTIEVI